MAPRYATCHSVTVTAALSMSFSHLHSANHTGRDLVRRSRGRPLPLGARQSVPSRVVGAASSVPARQRSPVPTQAPTRRITRMVVKRPLFHNSLHIHCHNKLEKRAPTFVLSQRRVLLKMH